MHFRDLMRRGWTLCRREDDRRTADIAQVTCATCRQKYHERGYAELAMSYGRPAA